MSKYNATPTTVNGVRFDSKKEADRFRELLLMLRAGVISDLRLQHNITLIEGWKTVDGETIRPEVYKADFSYIKDGRRVYEDTKGVKTHVFLLKRKQVLDKHGIKIVEV